MNGLNGNINDNSGNNEKAKNKLKKPGLEYSKTWAGIFQVGIFWVGIFRGGGGQCFLTIYFSWLQYTRYLPLCNIHSCEFCFQ